MNEVGITCYALRLLAEAIRGNRPNRLLGRAGRCSKIDRHLCEPHFRAATQRRDASYKSRRDFGRWGADVPYGHRSHRKECERVRRTDLSDCALKLAPASTTARGLHGQPLRRSTASSAWSLSGRSWQTNRQTKALRQARRQKPTTSVFDAQWLHSLTRYQRIQSKNRRKKVPWLVTLPPAPKPRLTADPQRPKSVLAGEYGR